MEPFEHVDAPSLAVARDLLLDAAPPPDPAATAAPQYGAAARPIAGGTDLLTTLKLGLHQPQRLVNLKTIPGLDTITDFAGTLRLGSLVALDTIARNQLVEDRYFALGEAARWAASPQLRNVGTLGGNLAQETRCWYYRNPDLRCWMKGGDHCYARAGENSHHAIFTDDSPCVSVHPSDPATALLALDAIVIVQTDGGERRVPLREFLTSPSGDRRQLTMLGPADLITGVELPPVAADRSASTYLKAMERAAWSFALAGVAVAVTWRENGASESGARVVERARIALGGVAPVPRRAGVAEDYLAGKVLDDVTAAEAGRLAVQDAAPLEHNVYKVRLAHGLVARALLQLLEAT